MTISKQHYHYLDFRVAFFLFFFFFPLFIFYFYFYFYFYFWEDIVIIIIHCAVHLGLLSRRVPRDSRDMGLKRFEKEKVVSTAFPLWKMVHSISMWGEPTGFIILGFYQQVSFENWDSVYSLHAMDSCFTFKVASFSIYLVLISFFFFSLFSGPDLKSWEFY